MATAFAWPRVRPIVKVYRHLKEAPVRTETESDPVSGHGCCGDGRSLPGVGLLGGWPNRDTVSRPLHARHWPCMPDSRAVTRGVAFHLVWHRRLTRWEGGRLRRSPAGMRSCQTVGPARNDSHTRSAHGAHAGNPTSEQIIMETPVRRRRPMRVLVLR